MPADAAAQTAAALVESDLRGHYSHGSFLVLPYLEELATGVLDPGGQPRVDSVNGAAARIDGGNGLGQLAAQLGITTAIELASSYSIGMVSVNSAGHFGAGAHWVQQAADAGMIGFATSTEPAGWVAAPNGAEGMLANLPYAWGFPGRDGDHLIFDMATGQIADGKLRLARLGIGELAPGQVVDSAGSGTSDPNQAAFIQPLGGPKGFGLTLAADALSGILAGVPGSTVRGKQDPQPGHTCQYFQAIDISALGDPDQFRRHLADQLAAVRSSRQRGGQHPVRVPGDRARAVRGRQLADGIELPKPIWNLLRDAAHRLGVSP